MEIRPPFPAEIVQLLQSSALCYLSTLAEGSPHLSLMNFTYYPADEKIIMSTRKDTTKFSALLEHRKVAVLMHDFPSDQRTRRPDTPSETTEASGQTYSVTLYGLCKVEDGADAERYRAAHFDRHGASQQQFIYGDNIAIITVYVEKARICNQADQVRIWEAAKAPRTPAA